MPVSLLRRSKDSRGSSKTVVSEQRSVRLPRSPPLRVIGAMAATDYATAKDVPNTGVSPLAIPADKQWDGGDRPKQWQGRVHGLVVHTTGGGLPAKARLQGLYHTALGSRYYFRSHGCHYLNGWRGAAGGDLLQLANERERANGVGVTNKEEPKKDQRRSVEAGRFEADLPAVLLRLWQARWPGYEHSLELLPPGATTANECYVHLECVPCVYDFNDKLVTDPDAEPFRGGLRFTKAQFETIALLAVDVARRNFWPSDEDWWRTPRLLGHEDLTPISRHDSKGGWDPGYLRERPYFDWEYVYDLIERIQRGEPGVPQLPDSTQHSIFAALGEFAQDFREMLNTGKEFLAVSAAHENGVRDVNDLTNLVFFTRHPELHERKIRPDETALAKEWLEIRDKIVQPSLERLAPTTGGK
jgi:hypothetical protein